MSSVLKGALSILAISTVGIVPLGCNDPNLQPQADDPAYCDRQDGLLLITVANPSNVAADPSVTRVEFRDAQNGSVIVRTDISTPAISALGEAQFTAPIPTGCSAAGLSCHFTITVDVLDDITEAFEEDNAVNGECLG